MLEVYISFILHITVSCYFMAIPIPVLYFFIHSLSKYRSEKRKQKSDPASVPSEQLSFLRWRLILSVFIVLVLAVVYAALLFLPAGDIAYM